MLELVGVAHLARRSTGNLSGGEQQRVALARALAVQPAVLLADEPFASVDASVRRDLQNLVTTVHRELGTTMLMVTHDLEEARKVADHWVVLEQGRVVAIGPPCDVIHRPTTEAMAQLFGLNTPAAKIIECSGRIDVRISASNVGQGGIVAGLRQVGTMIEVTVVDRECTFVTHVEPDRCPSIGDRLLIEGCAGQLELAGHPAR